VFHPYGRANVKPTVGGINYGNSMLTHNINPECGDNPPQYQQVYTNALEAGCQNTLGFRVPKIPRTKSTQILTAE